MITLLKNLECFCPEYIGLKDILIFNNVIYKVSEPGMLESKFECTEIMDCQGLAAYPGIIDGHIHITGGGGEKGALSRIVEITAEEIFLSGVTTIVGLLGADNRTRSLNSLYAKAKALESEGITSFIYSGSYEVPIITFTEDITTDLLLIDKVIGAGEVAIADSRSSHPDIKDMLTLSSKTYMGGLLSGKAGIVHLHVGGGKAGLGILNKIVKESDLPIDMFVPTHINRKKSLFNEGIEYALKGGNIDLTSGEKIGIPVPDAIAELIKKGVDFKKITVSSDANASTPEGGTSKIDTLYNDIIKCILKKKIKPSVAFSLVTENVSKRLKIYPKKGVIKEGSDADIIITDKNYDIKKLFVMGRLRLNDGKLLNN